MQVEDHRGMGRGGASRGQADRVEPVEVEPVRQGSIARHITLSGVVEPIRNVGVNSRLAGALRSVEVEEGDTVAAGAVLARLDDRELQAQLRSARASYEVARSAAERAEQLLEQHTITAAEAEREFAAYDVAAAQLEQLRTRTEFATVQAPIAGVVTEKHAEAGDVVGSQNRLFTLADISTMVVRVRVSELDVVELSAGDEVEVKLDAVPGRTLSGTIRRVFPAADAASRLIPVEVALSEGDAGVARPGFLARVRFALSVREDVILVPATAVFGSAGDEAAFVVEGERAVRRPVKTGLSSEGRLEIVEGLELGETVVVVGGMSLRDGSQVRVVEPSDTLTKDSVSQPDSPGSGAGEAVEPGGREP